MWSFLRPFTRGSSQGSRILGKRFASYRYNGFNQQRAYTNDYARFWQTYRRPIIYSGGVIGVIYVTNLESAPVSGRLRFMIVPKWLEKKVGDMGYRQTMSEFQRNILPANHPDSIHVRNVMKRLIAVSEIKDEVNWEIHVVGGMDYPPNAFVLPGGKVFVFQSILPICQNEDGLATVLAHETAHQVCRHSAESLSKSPFYFALGIVLYSFLGSSSINDLLINLGLRLPASRAMESEADYVGLMMMARACFQPNAAVGLWQRMMKMEQASGHAVPELLSTHPTSAHRIDEIRSHLPEANQVREERCSQSSFWSLA